MPVTVSYHTRKDKEKQTKAISAYNEVKESMKYRVSPLNIKIGEE